LQQNHYKQNREYRGHLSEWLQTYQWDYFHTVTFRNPRRDSIAALRDVGDVCSEYSSRAFIAAEPHFSGFLHVHAITFQDPDMRPYYLPWTIEERYRKRFGISAVQAVRGQEEVATYCSKYVTKGRAQYEFLGAPYYWNT